MFQNTHRRTSAALKLVGPCFCALAACPANAATFADDLAFLAQHAEAVVLRKGAAAIVVVRAYQGRVMTSAWDAANGPSLGWINRFGAIEVSAQP